MAKNNYEIPANELNAIPETLGDLINWLANESTGDEFPFPVIFHLKASILKAIFDNPNFEFGDIKNYKHYHSEHNGDSKKLPIISALEINPEEAQFVYHHDFENGSAYENFYLININNKPALYIEGADGYTSTCFSYNEIIFQA